MNFLILASSLLIAVTMGPLIKDMIPCKDIIDIYYTKELEAQAYDTECRYTKTEIYCNKCANVYISRKYYSRWVDNYKKENDGPVPFPKRSDMDRLFPALDLGAKRTKEQN